MTNTSQCTTLSGFINLGTKNSGICSSANSFSISGMNLETAKCEAVVPITCKNGWTYSSELKKCVKESTCPENSQKDPATGICVADVTCPYGSQYECKGDLLNSQCSKWSCDSFEKCGYAYCPIGTPSTVKNTSTTCIDDKCDVSKGSNYSECENKRCPEGFGIFQQNDKCYVYECPEGSYRENSNCYIKGCPQGTIDQGGDKCLIQ